LARHFRQAARTLIRDRAFAAITIPIPALGIGAHHIAS
jgi:hypothetical protein